MRRKRTNSLLESVSESSEDLLEESPRFVNELSDYAKSFSSSENQATSMTQKPMSKPELSVKEFIWDP